MIGGQLQSQDSRDFIVLPNTRCIDANLNYIEKEAMKTPRCSVPLAIVKDRWVLAMGGLVGRNKPTNIVSAFDTQLNCWFDC